MRSIVLAIAFSVLGVATAIACSCRSYDTAAEEVADTAALFRGRAIETNFEGGVWSVTTFEVLAPLKLPPDALNAEGRIEVRHYAGSTASCGIEFEIGETTLVGASVLPDGRLFTNYCRAPRFAEAAYRTALNLPPA